MTQNLKPHEIIFAKIEENSRQREALLARCEDVYAEIFNKFGITELAFSEPYSGMKYSRLRYFDFERRGRRLQLLSPRYGINFILEDDQYEPLLDVVLNTINKYLSIGLTPSEWSIGKTSEIESCIKDYTPVVANLKGVSDEFEKLSDTYENCIPSEAIKMTKELITNNCFKTLYIPKGKVMPAVRDFTFRTNIIEIYDGKMLYYAEENPIFPCNEKDRRGPLFYARLLKSVYESIEYYRANPNEIPDQSYVEYDSRNNRS